MTPGVVVIADDLTGAADTGVSFAIHGAETLVVWDELAMPEAAVLVLSTESRHGTAVAAARSVRAAAERLAFSPDAPHPRWIYKKIDSTLRGHPGPELAALAHTLMLPGALVAPAFPSQGRTTLGGHQFVDGVSLADTVFSREVPSSNVRRLLAAGFPESQIRTLPLDLVREGSPAVASKLSRERDRVWLADAEADSDLAILARAAAQSGIRLLCGAAGLGLALAEMLAGDYGWKPASRGPAEGDCSGQGVLVVAASRHPQTLAQVAAAEAAGISVIRPAPGWFADRHGAGTILNRLVAGLARGAVVLTTAGLPDMPAQERLLIERLGQAVATLVAQHRPAGLVLTGGDAAIAVSQALRAEGLRLHGTVAAGIPWGTLVGGDLPGVPVVTKAGGFGTENTLMAAVDFLDQIYGNSSTVPIFSFRKGEQT